MTDKPQTTKYWRIKVDGRYAHWSPFGWSLHNKIKNSTAWPTEQHAIDAKKSAPDKIKYDGEVQYV